MNPESRPTSLVPDRMKKTRFDDEHSGNKILHVKPKMKERLESDNIFYESDDSVNITVVETPKYDGSDSGVEMNVKYNRCLDLDVDGPFTPSCNSSIISDHSSSPCCGDDDVASGVSNLRQMSGELSGFLSPSCDGTSENGSESSSVGSSKACKANCTNFKRTTSIAEKSPSSCRSASANGRRNASPSNFDNNGRNIVRPSPTPKYDTGRRDKNATAINTTPCKVRNYEGRNNKTIRSLSSSRCCKTQSEDKKWSLDGRTSFKSKPPAFSSNSSTTSSSSISNNNNSYNNNNNNIDSDKNIGLFATFPRHSNKNRESNGRIIDGKSPASREPSLNRAASLRKKFVDNNLMTTSLTVPNNSSSIVVSSRTTSTNSNNPKVSKTKIYHEISTQTSLTNRDFNQIIAGIPTKLITVPVQMEDFTQQVDNNHEVDKIVEQKIEAVNEELKKLKADNLKQKNVIEWLEDELSSNKEEKFKSQSQMLSTVKRINDLLNHENQYTLEDTLKELERKINSSNIIITAQQEEINELQEMCCVMKKDLEKSVCIQKSLIGSQRATELESLELQEFLQAEKSLLSDSLKDLEMELNNCKERVVKLQEEVNDKTAQCSHLVRISEQQRQENLLLQVRFSHLEHRSKELLLQQGAAISSASVALSGLTARFDLLLEQLTNAYKISDADLEDGIYYNDAYSCSSGSGEETNDVTSQDNNRGMLYKMVEAEKCPASRKGFMFALLNAICNAATQSSILKQTITQTNNSDANMKKKCAYLTIPSIVTKSPCSKQDDSTQMVSASSTKNQSALNGKLSKSILMINDDNDLTVDLTKVNKRNSLPVTLNDDLDDANKMEFNFSESLNNLSEAILTRQIIEGLDEDDSLKEYLKQDISLVDQVIEIDNIVTKLLKAIRVIQISFNLEESGDSFWAYRNLKYNISNFPLKRNFSLSQESNHSDTHSDESSPLDVNSNPADLVFKVQHQRSVICKVLKMLRNMRDSMIDSTELQKIHDELESVSYVSCLESPISAHDVCNEGNS